MMEICLSRVFFVTLKKNMALFEEYKNHQDPFVRERANNWAIAIGLQRVDGLNVFDFLIEVARQATLLKQVVSVFPDSRHRTYTTVSYTTNCVLKSSCCQEIHDSNQD